MPTHTHSRIFNVHFGTNPSFGRKETVRYSKLRDLVITRSVDSSHQKYVLTHRRSGMAITSLPRLRQAFHALWLLLPLADWKQGHEALQYDSELLRKCREALMIVPAQVKTRRDY